MMCFKIRKFMTLKKINAITLSRKSNINILKTLLILYGPFYKIKLTQGLSISKALGVEVLDLF